LSSDPKASEVDRAGKLPARLWSCSKTEQLDLIVDVDDGNRQPAIFSSRDFPLRLRGRSRHGFGIECSVSNGDGFKFGCVALGWRNAPDSNAIELAQINSVFVLNLSISAFACASLAWSLPRMLGMVSFSMRFTSTIATASEAGR
jgi:hypothetical protein